MFSKFKEIANRLRLIQFRDNAAECPNQPKYNSSQFVHTNVFEHMTSHIQTSVLRFPFERVDGVFKKVAVKSALLNVMLPNGRVVFSHLKFALRVPTGMAWQKVHRFTQE